MPRLGDHKDIARYRKTRTGCERCKQRRVKCNEARPKCGNCSSLGYNCIYHQALPPYPIFDGGGPQEIGVVRFTVRELGLLHLWTISTGDTIGGTEEMRQINRNLMPSIALPAPYLLHIIFAVSSMHKAHLYHGFAEQKLYLQLGEYHYSVALPLFRANLKLISSTNGHTLYACAQMIVKYLFASEPCPERFFFSPVEDSRPEALALLRGAYEMRPIISDWVSGSSFECWGVDLLEYSSIPESDMQCVWLHHQFERLISFGRREFADTAGVEASRKAMQMLRHLFSKTLEMDRKANTKAICTAWLAQVPSEFFVRVRQRKPDAIFVLAHYCIVLEDVNNDWIWYMKGWSTLLFEECMKRLDSRWMPFFEWPLSVFRHRSTKDSTGWGQSLCSSPNCSGAT